MSFDATENKTILSRPHEHHEVVTACDELTSIVTKHYHIYDRGVRQFAIAFLILEQLRHDNL
jgi:hypothetical protein